MLFGCCETINSKVNNNLCEIRIGSFLLQLVDQLILPSDYDLSDGILTLLKPPETFSVLLACQVLLKKSIPAPHDLGVVLNPLVLIISLLEGVKHWQRTLLMDIQ